MGAKSIIRRALEGSRTQGQRVVHPQGTPTPRPMPMATATPVLTSPLAMPQGVENDDMTMIFLRGLRYYRDGAVLAMTLPRLIAVHPQGAELVISMGNLGGESRDRAVESLRVYARSGCWVVPAAV